MNKFIFSFLLALFFSVIGVTAFGQTITLPSSGDNTSNLTVTASDITDATYVAVGVIMPTSLNAKSQKLANGGCVKTRGLYLLDAGVTGFEIDKSLIPESAGGFFYITIGTSNGTEIVLGQTTTYQYVPVPNPSIRVPAITGITVNSDPASRTLDASDPANVISLTIENLQGLGNDQELLYCRILPAGVPFSFDRLPDVLVTSAVAANIGGSYSGSTFRVSISNVVGGVGHANVVIDGSALSKLTREYTNNTGVQTHQFREGLILHAVVVTNTSVSQYQSYYFDWEQETLVKAPGNNDVFGEPYGIRVYQTNTGGILSPGYMYSGDIRPTVNYLTNYNISVRYTPDVDMNSAISPKQLMFKIDPQLSNDYDNSGWDILDAVEATSLNNLEKDQLYFLDYFTDPQTKHFNIQQLLEENSGTVKILFKAVHAAGGVSHISDATKEYIFTSEPLYINYDGPASLRGTGTLTETPMLTETVRDPNGAYGWFIEQNGALVNTVNVNEPFQVVFATNYIRAANSATLTNNTWDGGELVPRLLIHDVANDAWTKHSSIPASMSMTDRGVPPAGTFGSTAFSNYYTYSISDYFKLIGINKEDYVEGGMLELKFGSFANSPTITRKASGVNTYPVYTSTNSRIVPAVTLTPSNIASPYRFDGEESVEIDFKVAPADYRLKWKSDARENTRIYFVAGPTGYIDSRKAWDYDSMVGSPIEPGRTYYTWNESVAIDFGDFLTSATDTLSIRTQATTWRTYSDHLRLWQYTQSGDEVIDHTINLHYSNYENVTDNLETIVNDLLIKNSKLPLTGGHWYMKDVYDVDGTGIKAFPVTVTPFINTPMMFGSTNQTRVFTYYYSNTLLETTADVDENTTYTINVHVTPLKDALERGFDYDSQEQFNGPTFEGTQAVSDLTSVSNGVVGPGEYDFVTSVIGSNVGGNTSFPMEDNTDSFLLVNLQGVADGTIIYSRYGKQIPANSTFSFSMQMANAFDRNYGTYGVKPDVEVRIVRVSGDDNKAPWTSEEVLASVRTGDIEMSGTWQDLVVEYKPAVDTWIGVEIVNKQPSILLGNLLAIDNIQFRLPKIPATIVERFSTICPTPEIAADGRIIPDINNNVDLVLSFDMNAMETFLEERMGPASTRSYYYYLTDGEGNLDYCSGEQIYTVGAEGNHVNDVVLGRNGHAIPRPKANGNLTLYLLFRDGGPAPTVASDFTDAIDVLTLPFEYIYKEIEILATLAGDTTTLTPGTPTMLREAVYEVAAGTEIDLTFNYGSHTEIDANKIVWFYFHGDGSVHDMKQHFTGDKITVRPIRKTTYGVRLPGCDVPVAVVTIDVDGDGVEFGTDEYAMRSDKLATYTYQTLYDPTASRIIIPLQNAPYPAEFKVVDEDGDPLDWLDAVEIGTDVDAATGATMGLILHLKKHPIAEGSYRGGTRMVQLRIDSRNTTYKEDFIVHFIAPTAVWTGERGSNWNEPNNWRYYTTRTESASDEINIRSGSIPGVPIAGTTVYIPGSLSNATYRYPDLSESLATVPTEYDGRSLNPVANEIIFEQGAVLGNQHLLYYHKAFVELNFGKSNSSGSQVSDRSTSDMLARERYYMLSSPLKDMYVGDLFMGARPSVFPRYTEAQFMFPTDADLDWDTDFTSIPSVTGLQLSNSTPTYNIPLNLGFGFAYGMAGGLNQNGTENESPFGVGNINPNINVSYDQTNINKKGGVVTYPRFENEKWGSDVPDDARISPENPERPYPHAQGAESYGFSHYESFFADKDAEGNLQGSGYTAYRYSAQGRPEVMVPDGFQGKNWIEEVERKIYTTPDYGIGAQTVYEGNRFIIDQAGTRTIEGKDNHGTPIASGNPFMAYLNLTDFYRQNGFTSTGVFYIYEGDNVRTINVWPSGQGNTVLNNGPGSNQTLSDEGSLVNLNPMQGFLFKPYVPSGESFTINFDKSMTRSHKVNAIGEPGGIGMRSKQAVDYSMLSVSVSNNDGENSVTIVRHANVVNMPENGAALLMSPTYKLPEIFVNKSGTFEAISHFSESVTSIPLGIINMSKDSQFTLSVGGLENVPYGQEAYLYDAKLGKEKVLTAENNTYDVDGVVNTAEENQSLLNRFFIGFRDVTVITDNGDNILDKSGIYMWTDNNWLNVTSGLDNLIKTVRIYNLQGAVIASYDNLSTPSFNASINVQQGVYIVDVQSEKGTSHVQKVVIK